MHIARAFRILMGQGIFALRQTLRPGLPTHPLVRLVDCITNDTLPGHECSSVSRGTSISKCTISRGYGWKSDLPHFRGISRSTRQSINTSRLAWAVLIHFATPPAGSPTVAHAMKAPAPLYPREGGSCLSRRCVCERPEQGW